MWIAEQYVYMNADKYEDKAVSPKGGARAMLTSMRKQKSGGVKYSKYFASFWGDAYKKISENPDIKSMKVLSAYMDNSPYTNADGETVYPKSPTMYVYDVDEITYNDTSESLPY